MSDAPKKCAHPACSCTVSGHDKYCSDICKDSHTFSTLKCDCKHPECEAKSL